MEKLAKQILKISYELGLSHIGSCLSVLPIFMEIYRIKKPEDIVVSSAAHHHLAHLVIKDDEEHVKPLVETFGIHCDRMAGCDASGGSLGHGIGIGIGYALADRNRDVYVVTSDGALNEGSEWEALRLRDQLNLTNLKVYANCNGYTATGRDNTDYLESRLHAFRLPIKIVRTTNGISFLHGINGHYDVLTEETYQKAIKEIEENERLVHDLT